MTPKSPFAPRTILVYSGLELMGDGFMKIPFLRALRGAWAQAHITWLAGIGKTVYAGALRPLVAAYLDEIIEDAGIGLRLAELLHRPLAGRRFDLVIDTQRRVPTTLVLRRIRHEVFVSGAADFRLSDRVPARPYRKPPAMIAQMLDLIRAASGAPLTFTPASKLPAAFEAAARAALPEGETCVGLVPGAGGRHKCWPLDRYIELARRCRALALRPVFLLGPDERPWLARLSSEVPDACFPLQAPDPLAASPIFTVALGRHLAFAVSNDCGTAHMLAAADCPLISLFGPTDPAKFAPLIGDLTVLRAQDFGGTTMEAIPLAAVVATVERRLARHRQHESSPARDGVPPPPC
ncbi:MAG TPA: glycosyltransferase family 9 protein [Alphaproteobacteria bacterium]|nr:glycosyltransferase family 9 protein [Alphaproteobacteria bacterium]